MAHFLKFNRDLTESTFSVGNITAPKGESHSHLKLITAVSDCSKTCQGPPNNLLRWSLLPVLQAVAIWFELVEAPTALGVSFPHPFPSPLSLTHFPHPAKDKRLFFYDWPAQLLQELAATRPGQWYFWQPEAGKTMNGRCKKVTSIFAAGGPLSFPGSSYGQAPSVRCTHTHTGFARILKWNVSMLLIGFQVGVDMVWIKTLYFSSAGQCLMVDSFLFYEVIIGPGFVKTIYYMSPKLQNSIKVVIQSMSPSFTFFDLPPLWWLRGSSVNKRPLNKQWSALMQGFAFCGLVT